MNLACINALSTLGGQQQAIAQNKQNYDLTKLQSLGSLLQGYNIPVGTKTTLCMSPFSAAGALGAGGLGLITPKYDKDGNPIKGSEPINRIKKTLGGLGGKGGGGGGGGGGDCCCCDCCDCCTDCCDCCSCCCCVCCCADGGSVDAKKRGYSGCASTSSRGAKPFKKG
jgi:hypothetical protein